MESSLFRPKQDKTVITSYAALYTSGPPVEISMDELIEYAYFRSRVHENILAQAQENNNEKNCEAIEKIMVKHYLPIGPPKTRWEPPIGAIVPDLNPSDQKEYDELSFNALLLISLRNEESQRLFINNETQIFYARVRKGLKGNLGFLDELIAETKSYDIRKDRQTDGSFLVDFEKIIASCDTDTLILKDGKITIQRDQLDRHFTTMFNKYLNMRCAQLKQHGVHTSDLAKVAAALFDERTGNFNIKQRKDYRRVSLEDIGVAVRSFPPCMRNMYDTLTKQGKLFFDGRLQLGLFVKGIGLTMDESLKFWQKKFTGMTVDDFEKNYAYNIRHTYGKEGAGKSLSAYSCAGIHRVGNPSAGQCHGCPFKFMKDDQLRELIGRINPHISDLKRSEILGNTRIPGIACAMLFNSIHPDEPFDETGISHPNVYFIESERRYEEAAKKEEQ